jgi:hypothetical protein
MPFASTSDSTRATVSATERGLIFVVRFGDTLELAGGSIEVL